MTRTKATVRRLRTFLPAPGQRTGNKDILNRRLRNAPFKIKKLLPQTKQAEVKNNGQVVRRMNVRQKSYYFSENRRLQFQSRKKLLCVYRV